MLLAAMIAVPVLAALAVALMPRGTERLMWWLALAAVLAVLALGARLYMGFDASLADLQFEQNVPWIPSFGISWHVGVDGISLLMVLLTALLGPVVVLASWDHIQKHVKEFLVALLVLQGAMVGVFAAWDLFLFYVFWEAVLVPMYLLIGVWGSGDRIRATIKFFLYTLAASLLMLAAVVALYVLCGAKSFDFGHLYAALPAAGASFKMQCWMLAAFLLAFAVKVPLFPFHTWLPDAHTEAPTAGSVILAGVMLKMGTYGIIRLALPLFPAASLAFLPWLGVLAITGIIYGALVAMVQTDIKRLVAYSSVSHLGFVVLGIAVLNAQGLDGAIIQMVNHGLSTGALFLGVGFLYARTHSRRIADHGGLAGVLPLWAVLFAVAMLSSIALPGLNGFVGEFLILLGAFRGWGPLAGTLAASGMVLSAVYMLWLYKRIAWGEPSGKAAEPNLRDLNFREAASMLILTVFMVWIGVYPNVFLGKVRASSSAWLRQAHAPMKAPGLPEEAPPRSASAAEGETAP